MCVYIYIYERFLFHPSIHPYIPPSMHVCMLACIHTIKTVTQIVRACSFICSSLSVSLSLSLCVYLSPPSTACPVGACIRCLLCLIRFGLFMLCRVLLCMVYMSCIIFLSFVYECMYVCMHLQTHR